MIKKISAIFLTFLFVFSVKPAQAATPSINISGYSVQDTIRETSRSAVKFQTEFKLSNADVGATFYYVFSANTNDKITSIDTQNGSNYLSYTSQPNSQYPYVVADAGGSATVIGYSKINLASGLSSGSETLNNFVVTLHPSTNLNQSYVSNSISPAPSINYTIPTPTPTKAPTPTPSPTSAITPTQIPTPTPTEAILPTEIPTPTPVEASLISASITPTPTPTVTSKKSSGSIIPILFIVAGFLLCIVPLALTRPDIFKFEAIKNKFFKPKRKPPQSTPFEDNSPQQNTRTDIFPPQNNQDIPEIR